MNYYHIRDELTSKIPKIYYNWLGTLSREKRHVHLKWIWGDRDTTNLKNEIDFFEQAEQKRNGRVENHYKEFSIFSVSSGSSTAGS